MRHKNSVKTATYRVPGTSQSPGFFATFRPIFIALLFAFGLSFFPAGAAAQQVVLPRKGMQYITAGLSLDPGFIYDSSAQARSNTAPGTLSASAYALGAAGMAEVGITQIINPQFFMSAELGAGAQWLREHTAAPEGVAESGAHFAWQAGLYAHWLPFGDLAGYAGSAGVQLFRAHLEDAPLQMLAADIRLGKYLWTSDERFLLLQIGYALPLIQGLSRSTDFDESGAQLPEETWSFHRFSLGFQYGF